MSYSALCFDFVDLHRGVLLAVPRFAAVVLSRLEFVDQHLVALGLLDDLRWSTAEFATYRGAWLG